MPSEIKRRGFLQMVVGCFASLFAVKAIAEPEGQTITWRHCCNNPSLKVFPLFIPTSGKIQWFAYNDVESFEVVGDEDCQEYFQFLEGERLDRLDSVSRECRALRSRVLPVLPGDGSLCDCSPPVIANHGEAILSEA